MIDNCPQPETPYAPALQYPITLLALNRDRGMKLYRDGCGDYWMHFENTGDWWQYDTYAEAFDEMW